MKKQQESQALKLSLSQEALSTSGPQAVGSPSLSKVGATAKTSQEAAPGKGSALSEGGAGRPTHWERGL